MSVTDLKPAAIQQTETVMTIPTTRTPYNPDTEARDVAQRFAAALADFRAEPLDTASPGPNAFVLDQLGLCVTSMAGGDVSTSLARLDRIVAQDGIDALMVRIVFVRTAKQVLFDAVLRSGERTESFAGLNLLIDGEGGFWLVPASASGQGLMLGRSGLLPVRDASEFHGAVRQAGLTAGLRLLAGEDL